MKLYNSRSRKIEEFKSLQPNIVKMYSCGPTVYDHAHIGNIRAFIFADTLRKSLEFLNYQVTQVMNITDFGHLKGDGDDGEDKMSLGLKREKFPRTIDGMKMLADKYSNIFLDDITKVNIKRAMTYPRAIEHIEEYIKIIQGLEQKGFTYKISDGIYFDTQKDKNYGCMSLLDHNHQAESRIGEKTEKKNQADFCLWKFSDENLSVLGFPSPWGAGFPGWHIECSGMVLKFLGEQIDIHTGGVDHINVHHTNEIAQSENYTGKTYSTFFCHNEFVNINDQKMAKSSGEFITVQTLIEKNFNPLSFRYLTLQNHYRKKMNFSWESLEASQTALHKLQRLVANFTHTNTRELDENYLSEFKKSLEDDLNIPEALATLWKLVKDSAVSENKKYWTALEMDRVLSLDLGKEKSDNQSQQNISDPKVQELINLRNQYRAEKNWTEADKIRDQLVALGVEVKDK